MKRRLSDLSPAEREQAEQAVELLYRLTGRDVRQKLEEDAENILRELPEPIVARILINLTLRQLNVMATLSRYFRDIARRYKLRERIAFDGKVYGFGDNRVGQTGTTGMDNEAEILEPRPVQSSYNRNVTQISAGSRSAGFISNGRVYLFGNQFQEDPEDHQIHLFELFAPELVPGPFNRNVTQLSCARKHTAFVSNGQVYAFGYGAKGKLGDGIVEAHGVGLPRLMDGRDNRNVTHVSCAEFITAFIANGRLYMCGDGEKGALGDGVIENHAVAVPRLVSGEHNRDVTAVSCGYAHTVFISNGRVYAFGDGMNGALGDGNPNEHFVPVPQLVTGPHNVDVTHVSCDVNHTAFITNGRVYTFGLNWNGMLGLNIGDEAVVPVPWLVVGPYNRNVTHISCGKYHTAFVADGILYTFGKGTHGRLGNEFAQSHDRETPQPVSGPYNQQVTQVECGKNFTLFLTQFAEDTAPVPAPVTSEYQCVGCDMASPSMCDVCDQVLCADCFEKTHP